jgi:hypothetical protein
MCFMGIDTTNSSTYNVLVWTGGLLFSIPSSSCK